ncbi:aarF domain-containing kinase [Fistulifera solaris]|uniref:AarF domain-containing kinase n=1 Tax=Fistulifera solaris TaxID=1519565 RepID=A0A1Z5JRR5_FISSO|nr:aarF domain-containing kinase [Fistulifera solaris]|eukprot:GAX16704.1 aarF domain-containing kinase [Fistulifera solaris]
MSASIALLKRSQRCISPIGRRTPFGGVSVLRRTPATCRIAGNVVLLAAAHIYTLKHGSHTLCSSEPPVLIRDDIEPEFLISDTDDKTVASRALKWLEGIIRKCYDVVMVTFRATEISLYLSPLLILTPTSMLISGLGFNFFSEMTWRYTLYAVQHLGPSSVKLCQWMATRRDLFPSHICDRLSVLHDKAFPHSWHHTVATLKEAFGDDYQENGLLIKEEDILGCGSAAQVYQGVLMQRDKRGNEVERPVAVKVLHPNIKRNVHRDIWLMEAVAGLVHSIPLERIRMLNLPRATRTFVDILRRQTDLGIEAQNLRQFRANFYENDDHESRSEIIFPRPMEGWVHEKVLVEELAQNAHPIATSLTDDSLEGHKTRRQLGKQLCRAFFKMIFWHNFIHCDLHPGNVQVKRLEKEEQRTTFFGRGLQNKIVLLDAGIAFSLDPNDQRNLRDLFRAVVLNDGETAGRLMVERAKYERCSEMEGGIEAFAAEMQSIVEEFHNRRKGGGLTFGSVRIGSLLNRVLDVCRIYGVEIDPNMSAVVVSCLVVEGLVRSLDPNLNLIDAAIPFVIGIGGV